MGRQLRCLPMEESQIPGDLQELMVLQGRQAFLQEHGSYRRGVAFERRLPCRPGGSGPYREQVVRYHGEVGHLGRFENFDQEPESQMKWRMHSLLIQRLKGARTSERTVQ